MRFSGINHLAMITGDMDKTITFYRDILGMPLVATTGNQPNGYPFRHYFFKMGEGSTIAFFEWPGMVQEKHKPAGLPMNGWLQFDHISFNVDDHEALVNLKSHLESCGLEVTEMIDHRIIHSIYFTDPNGIALEASYWVSDPTQNEETDYSDNRFFEDPDPVSSVRPTSGISGSHYTNSS